MGDIIGSQQTSDIVNVVTETKLFLGLAIPTTLLSIGFVVPPLLTASFVGLKFGPTYLSAFTLGNLTGNLCVYSLLAGLFSAADTLSPQAYAKGNYQEVGFVAIRGVFASLVLVVPINVLLVMFMEELLIALGQDLEAAHFATRWYQIYVLGIPFFVFYMAVWKFLSAQHVMIPLIYVSAFSCLVILPAALEIFTESHGFLGSAVAIVLFQALQSILLCAYLFWRHPHTDGTWPGLGKWREALRLKPMLEYLHLATGGILAQSEWVYWECLGLIVGQLGVRPLAVHSIGIQVIVALSMPPYGFGIALAIRMGHTMTTSVMKTKQLVTAVVAISTSFYVLVSVLVFIKAGWITSWFTTDEDVIVLSSQMWGKVCLLNASMALFSLLGGVATGLGRQWSLGAVNFFFLWIVGLPATIYFATVKGGGVGMVWTWMNIAYLGLNVVLVALFLTANWGSTKDRIEDEDDDDVVCISVEGGETGKVDNWAALPGEQDRLLSSGLNNADYSTNAH